MQSKLNMSSTSSLHTPEQASSINKRSKLMKTNEEVAMPLETKKSKSDILTRMSGVSTKIDSTKRLTTKKHQRDAFKMCDEFSQITSKDFFLNESNCSKGNTGENVNEGLFQSKAYFMRERPQTACGIHAGG